MRSLNPILAASTLILVLTACSPKPEAATADSGPTEDVAGTAPVSAEPADAATMQPGELAPPQVIPAQERPQGMPAEPGRPRGRGMDGPMTLEDMQTRSDRRFDRMDANGDGAVTPDEMGDGDGRGTRMLERADANNDGRITRAEMQAGTAAMFRMMDSNGDGKVTEEERPQF